MATNFSMRHPQVYAFLKPGDLPIENIAYPLCKRLWQMAR